MKKTMFLDFQRIYRIYWHDMHELHFKQIARQVNDRDDI